MNKDFQIIHVNTAWAKLTGYELAEIEGKTDAFLQGPKTDMNAIQTFQEGLLIGNNQNLRTVYYNKSKVAVAMKVIVVPIHGGYLDNGKAIYSWFDDSDDRLLFDLI